MISIYYFILTSLLDWPLLSSTTFLSASNCLLTSAFCLGFNSGQTAWLKTRFQLRLPVSWHSTLQPILALVLQELLPVWYSWSWLISVIAHLSWDFIFRKRRWSFMEFSSSYFVYNCQFDVGYSHKKIINIHTTYMQTHT